MQFKHPELLYALFLLLIPVIVHLFQLRKFKKEAFTNVAFLKKVTLQTRKSSQLKKWLTLATRLLLLAAIILAFAQPFTSNYNAFKTKTEMVVYLDNSFSMQAKGNNGELLKRAAQDIIAHVPENDAITLVTNNTVYKNTTVKTLKNELLQLDYSPQPLTVNAALLKSNSQFSKQKNVLKNLIFISDFQQKNGVFDVKPDSLTHFHLVKLSPVNTNNVSIDSAYVHHRDAASVTVNVVIKNSGKPLENLPVSLFNNDTLIAKTAVSVTDKAETGFSIPTNKPVNATISINDTQLQFDNRLFFNIDMAPKINVLAINGENDSFLRRIYTPDEFNYTASELNQLDYNVIDKQHLIILNEPETIPNALAGALKQFANQGGFLVVIPAAKNNIEDYNDLLVNFNTKFRSLTKAEKHVTSINFSHPLFNDGVFEKKVDNFQYPKASHYYTFETRGEQPILSFEDGKAFLFQNNNTYIFTAPLNLSNSNFKSAPLIVPTLYNLGKFSLKLPHLYYTVGKTNSFDIDATLQQDHILSLENNSGNFIPKQQLFNNKVVITTHETPNEADIYAIKNKGEVLKYVSYNYGRDESVLNYTPLFPNIKTSSSIAEIFDTIKSDTKVNALWKWFVIFALLLLIAEMLILKFFK
ncbi:MAG: BatA domain-containing protein [Flavobacteriaceae bacterium]